MKFIKGISICLFSLLIILFIIGIISYNINQKIDSIAYIKSSKFSNRLL